MNSTASDDIVYGDCMRRCAIRHHFDIDHVEIPMHPSVKAHCTKICPTVVKLWRRWSSMESAQGYQIQEWKNVYNLCEDMIALVPENAQDEFHKAAVKLK